MENNNEREMQEMMEKFQTKKETIQEVREMFPSSIFPDVEEQMIAHYSRGTELSEATLMSNKSILIGTFPDDTEKVPYEYGIISKQYNVVTHEEAIKSMIDILPDFPEFGQPKYSIRIFDDGAKMKFNVDFPEIDTTDIAENDPVAMRLTGQNSYDLAWEYRFAIEAFMLICSNGLMGFQKLGGYNNRHKNSLNLDYSGNVVAGAMGAFSEQTKIWKTWADKQLGVTEFKEIVDGLPFGRRHTQEILELPIIQKDVTLKELGMSGKVSLWDVNLAASQFLTHEVESEMVKADKGEKLAKYLHVAGMLALT